MKKFLHICVVLLIGLTLANCSSDDGEKPTSLIVNGADFTLGGSGYNIIKSKSSTSLWLNIREKGAAGRMISIYAMHEPGTATGTYALKNDMIESGIATPALYDSDNNQISGGSDLSEPTGTISINEFENNHYIVTFNDVTLDPGTASETTIEGVCDKTFKSAPGN